MSDDVLLLMGYRRISSATGDSTAAWWSTKRPKPLSSKKRFPSRRCGGLSPALLGKAREAEGHIGRDIAVHAEQLAHGGIPFQIG